MSGLRCGVELDFDDAREAVNVGVVGKQCRASAPGDSRDHAIEHSPRGDARSAATTIDSDGPVEVAHRVEAQHLKAPQQPAQVSLSSIVTRAGQNLHDHRLGNRYGTVRFDQSSEAKVRGAASRAVVLDPDRAVDEDHAGGCGGTSAGSSAMAWRQSSRSHQLSTRTFFSGTRDRMATPL